MNIYPSNNHAEKKAERLAPDLKWKKMFEMVSTNNV